MADARPGAPHGRRPSLGRGARRRTPRRADPEGSRGGRATPGRRRSPRVVRPGPRPAGSNPGIGRSRPRMLDVPSRSVPGCVLGPAAGARDRHPSGRRRERDGVDLGVPRAVRHRRHRRAPVRLPGADEERWVWGRTPADPSPARHGHPGRMGGPDRFRALRGEPRARSCGLLGAGVGFGPVSPGVEPPIARRTGGLRGHLDPRLLARHGPDLLEPWAMSGDAEGSVFTPAEIAYLRQPALGRIATVGTDGQPHVTPVTFHYNEAEDAIDVGGIFWGATKKWRDAQHNPRLTLLVDDVIGPPRRARAI